MDMDFEVSRPLVRSDEPLITFLFIGSRFCSALPRTVSQDTPCASLPFTSIRLVEDFNFPAVEHARHTTAVAPATAFELVEHDRC